MSGGELECNYLVVGAGTAGLSFVDTILTENASATVVVVDKNSRPGGHWTRAYPFVRLHQPSCFYGVNSIPLGRGPFDINDRATGTEVLEYFREACRGFEAGSRVRFLFDAAYLFDDESGAHSIVFSVPNDGDDDDIGANARKEILRVKCDKLVTVASDVVVPSMRAPLVPVDERVNFVPVNDVVSHSARSGDGDSDKRYINYIVFGNGKTGVDAITNMLESGIDQTQITWVISRDNWYFLRDSMRDFYGMMDATSKGLLSSRSAEECFLLLEESGFMCRLDPNGPCPKVYKGALVDSKELKMIQSIHNVVRMGRAKSIQANRIILERGSLDFHPQTTLLVDCMVDNFYGYSSLKKDFTIFEPGRINLGPTLSAGNFSFSSAHIAFLECSLEDDASKNGCCYFLRGKYLDPGLQMFVGLMYMQVKCYEALMNVKGGMAFLMGSRTNMSAPMHHRGGILGMMWNFFGPRQLHRFGHRLVARVESRGFSDIDHSFGIETFKVANNKKNKEQRYGFLVSIIAGVGVAVLSHHYFLRFE